MIVLSIEEFAAKRRGDQDAMEKDLYPEVHQAMEAYPVEGWYNDLLATVARTYLDVFHREGGTGQPSPSAAEFTADVRTTLDKTSNPTAATTDRVSVWLSTAILNAATQAAAGTDEEFLLMEWVTMHDDDVREAHADTAGQQRPTTEPFDVDGTPMRYPGDPVAPIELWINCRCTLAPVLASESMTIQARDVSTEERKKDAGAGRAMPDGSYPIDNCQDLRNAIQAIGRAKDPGKVKAHIKRRKSSLGCPDVSIPEDWSNQEGTTMTTTEPEVTKETAMDAPLAWHGVLAPEGVWSGDGRQFAPDSLRFRDLPIPLTWQKSTDQGHDGSVVVGAIRSIERKDGMMQAAGTFLRTPEADEVVGLLAEFGKFGVSVDADDAEFEFSETDERVTFTSARIASASIVSIPAFAEAFVALGEWADSSAPPVDAPVDEPDYCNPDSPDYDPTKCTESTDEAEMGVSTNTFDRGPGWVTNPEDTRRLHDYWTKPGEPGYEKIAWGVGGDFNRCRALVGEKIAENSPEDTRFLNQICAQWHHDALGYWPAEHDVASANSTTYNGLSTWTTTTTSTFPTISLIAAPVPKAPAAWFKNPELDGPTHLTVTEDGRVFGHIAEWSACHIGFDGVCVAPPKSEVGYAYYASKSVLLDDGTTARTGVISLGGGHAKDRLSVGSVTAHYDSTSTAVADVSVGEDDHGIWCAGWVRPGAKEEDVYALRASDVSGDWREIGGNLELVAALAVNVGGFPTVSVGVENGQQVSLVAAGALRSETNDDVIDALAEKIEKALAAREERRVKMSEIASRWERRTQMQELRSRVETATNQEG